MSDREPPTHELRIRFREGSGDVFVTEAELRGPGSAAEGPPVITKHVLPPLPRDVELSLPSLARMFRAGRSTSRQLATDAQVVGATLFESLFCGELDALYKQISGRGDAARTRIYLDFPPFAQAGESINLVTSLPWEALFDVRREDHIALMPWASLVRIFSRPNARLITRPWGPLSLLVIAVDTADGSFATELEVRKLSEEAGLVDAAVKVIRNPGPEEFLGCLRDTRADVVHIIDTVLASDPFRLPLPGRSGGPLDLRAPAWLSATQCSEPGAISDSVQLVYLSACRSLQFASTLLNAVPAVVAMQGEILVEEATEVARIVYQKIYSGLALDLAIGEARRAIDRTLPGKAEWALPVLATGAPGPFELYVPDVGDSELISFAIPEPTVPPAIHVLQMRRQMAEINIKALMKGSEGGAIHPNIQRMIDEEQSALALIDGELASLRGRP